MTKDAQGEMQHVAGEARRRGATFRAALIGLAAALCCCAGPASASALPARFGTEGTGPGQISSEAQGIALDQESGDVYVADRNNNRIDKFGPEGEFLLAFGWGVADGESEELQSCTATCFLGREGPGAGEFNSPEGIAVNNDPSSLSHGDVYVVDTRNLRVQKFDPEGKFLTMFGGEVNAATKTNICPAIEAASCQAGVEGSGPGQFEGLAGRGIAVDSEGTVYVGDRNRVQRFSEEGVLEGEVAFPGVGRIQNLAVDSAKDIYLWGGLQEGVHKYDPAGTELGTPRDEPGFPEGLAITIGPADELLVNDLRETHHILAFDPEGEQTASYDRGGLAENGSRGIAYSQFAKALYILNKGAVRIVTPPPPGPFILLESEAVSEAEPTSAKLEATANPEGGEATKCHFDYGLSTAYGQSTPEEELTGASFEDEPVSSVVTGLSPGTTYHFRALCENAAEEVGEGADQTFTTLPPVSIDGTSASQVNATSARLEAELNPHGLASEYRFEYGTSTAYGRSVPIPDGSAGSGKADTTVSNLIGELTPSTTYHYRVTAHNALGSVTGPDRSFTTQGPSSILPDGRAWELVSPPNKHGSPLEPITAEGGLVQSAADGGAFAYVSLGPVNDNAEEPKGVRSPSDAQLLSRRGAGGWSTQDISTPHEELSNVRAGFPSEYQFFAEDLSAGIVEPEGETPLSPQTSEKTPYRREADGQFVPLVTAANVPPGTKFGGSVNFVTASPDLAHIVLASRLILAPGFAPGFEANAHGNLYELFEGNVTLLSVLPSHEPASGAGLDVSLGHGQLSMRGAISSDGTRAVFATSGEAHLYLRDLRRAQTLQLDERQPGATGGPGTAVFQAASEDASKIFFTDASRLTKDSTGKPSEPDLYMCKVGESKGQLTCALSDLSVDPNPGEAANVQGEVSAIDASGGHVYFAANGVLTSTPNARGEVAVPGVCNGEEDATCNLYVYDTDTQQIALVAVLSAHDDPDWAGRTNLKVLGELTARSSPNGRYFTFMSRRSLTGYDNRDARSGQADEEVFQFDSQSGELSCVSCDPTGARPGGVFDTDAFPGLLTDRPRTWGGQSLAGSIPGWTLRSAFIANYQSRYLSNSGREFFNSPDALVPQDTNNLNDVYEFEPAGVGDCSTSTKTYSTASHGCVALISSGSSKEESGFLDASESGDEVFFLSAARLVGTDIDGALDVYDAHVCSSSSPCPPPPPPPPPPAACEGDSCQNPSSPPGETTPSSLTYKGPENPPPPAVATEAKSKAKPLTRAQKLAAALKTCRSKPKGKRRACERHARRHEHGSTTKRAAGRRVVH